MTVISFLGRLHPRDTNRHHDDCFPKPRRAVHQEEGDRGGFDASPRDPSRPFSKWVTYFTREFTTDREWMWLWQPYSASFPAPPSRTRTEERGRRGHLSFQSLIIHVAHLAADITQFKPKCTQFYEKWWFRNFSPLAAGFSHKDNPQSLDLNCVRLCFQVFLEGNEKGAFTFALKPVVSDPIYDKSELFSFHPMKSVLMMRKLNRGKDGIVDMPHDRIQRVCRRWKGHAALLRQSGQGWHTG